MKMCVCMNEENALTDIFGACSLGVYESEQQWSLIQRIPLGSLKNKVAAEVRKYTQEICILMKEVESNLLIGTEILGLPYQILNQNGIILCEADTVSDQLFEEIYEDFYCEENQIQESLSQVLASPICVSEDGCYFFNFDQAIKAHPDLSSKKMLIPFLKTTFFESLTILCSHIMPWLEFYVEQNGLVMESNHEEGHYMVHIKHDKKQG